MKFDHKVKYKGKWYMPGEEIKEADKSTSDFSTYMNPPIEQKTYTKTDINRMSTSDLQALATEQGIDNAEELTGTELKKLLIEKLGLEELNYGIHHIRTGQNQT